MWQLTEPQLDADYVLLDEAQDTDEVVLAVLNAQKSTRRIVCGDSAQSIYEWRGAVNALGQFPGSRLRLTQSFRFGDAIAGKANEWLATLGTDMRLTGNPRIPSKITTLPESDAVLCRTNATALSEAMQLLEAGKKVAIVGGGDDIRALAEAAITLKEGKGCYHPELLAFGNWAELVDHVENDPSGSDLKVMVKLIDDNGPDKVIACMDALSDETACDTVVGTTHKVKGLEYDSVRIAGDFKPPKRDPEHPRKPPVLPPADARLGYVAVTRARLSLDPTSTDWLKDFLPDRGAAA
jgi:hypothetical protein